MQFLARDEARSLQKKLDRQIADKPSAPVGQDSALSKTQESGSRRPSVRSRLLSVSRSYPHADSGPEIVWTALPWHFSIVTETHHIAS